MLPEEFILFVINEEKLDLTVLYPKSSLNLPPPLSLPVPLPQTPVN